MVPAPGEAAFRDDLIAWATEGEPIHPAVLASTITTFLGIEYARELIAAIVEITG